MHLGILVVHIKILLLLSLFVFCNVQVLFHVIFFLNLLFMLFISFTIHI